MGRDGTTFRQYYTRDIPGMRPIQIKIFSGKGAKSYLTMLQERLDKQGIKAAELAREAEMDRSQLSRWFNNPDMDITLSNVQRLEEAFLRLVKKRGAARGIRDIKSFLL